MPSFGQFASGAAGGAMIGSVLGPAGSALGGLVGAGVGALASLFDQSPESQMEERYKFGLGSIANMRSVVEATRKRVLGQTIGIVSKYGRGVVANAGAGAARRYAAGGFGTGTEGVINAAETPAIGEVTNAISGATLDVNKTYDSMQNQLNAQEMDLNLSYMGRPAEPGISQTLLAVGPQAMQYKANTDYIAALKNLGPGGSGAQDYGTTSGNMRGSGVRKTSGFGGFYQLGN